MVQQVIILLHLDVRKLVVYQVEVDDGPFLSVFGTPSTLWDSYWKVELVTINFKTTKEGVLLEMEGKKARTSIGRPERVTYHLSYTTGQLPISLNKIHRKVNLQ